MAVKVHKIFFFDFCINSIILAIVLPSTVSLIIDQGRISSNQAIANEYYQLEFTEGQLSSVVTKTMNSTHSISQQVSPSLTYFPTHWCSFHFSQCLPPLSAFLSCSLSSSFI